MICVSLYMFSSIASYILIRLQSPFTVTYYFVCKIPCMNTAHGGHTEPPVYLRVVAC